MDNLHRHSPQAQAYADAIMEAITSVAKQFERADMGALLGALCGVQAHLIAGVSDAKLRKGLRRDLDKMLSSLIREQIDTGANANVQTIIRRAH